MPLSSSPARQQVPSSSKVIARRRLRGGLAGRRRTSTSLAQRTSSSALAEGTPEVGMQERSEKMPLGRVRHCSLPKLGPLR
mmetsp:Transcript_2448/g.6301  ORF Transcript_2448/g.6301 Transcript_2448/m.6301 type:complete len:81 (+) Transcript_2448:227-469(+)